MNISQIFATICYFSLLSPFLNSNFHGLKLTFIIFFLWLITFYLFDKKNIIYFFKTIYKRKYEFFSFIVFSVIITINYLSGRVYSGYIHFTILISILIPFFKEISYAHCSNKITDSIKYALLLMISLETLYSLPILIS